jgi:hypothetical protein
MSYLKLAKKISGDTDPTEGRILAIEISSNVLQAHIWLAFDDSFKADDGQAVFYGSELPALRGKTPEELRMIHMVELSSLGSGSRVHQ